MLDATLAHPRPHGFRTTEPPTETEGVIEAWIEFETAVGRGRGLLRLRDGKAWTLLTALYELKGHEEPRADERPKGAEHGADRDRETWLDRRVREGEELGYETQPYVLIVGGGQGGIALGARLRQLGVPTIIVDKHPRPGDQWRKRYKSLCLHDPVWYDHLPYLKFPENWPVFSPKDKIGDWLESYTRVMEVPYWSTTDGHERQLRRRHERVDRRGRARGPAAHAAPEAARARDRDVGQAERARASPARTSSAATSTTPRPTPARTPTPARGASSSARTTRRSTSAAPSGRTAST